MGEAKAVLTSIGTPIKPFYGPHDVEHLSYEKDLNEPGEFPYTRGIYSQMYRDQLWRIRLYAGFSTAQDTNDRFKFLLKNGQTALSVALDLPTQLGYDSDHPRAVDDAGRLGVAINTLDDMERIFQDIPLDKISTSFTINATAIILYAMYLVTGEKQGAPMANLRGAVQNDILKEYVARGNWIFPPGPSVKLVGDCIEYTLQHSLKFTPINVSGTHMHESGATSAQEIAYVALNALAYIEEVLKRGHGIDQVAPLFAFHLSANGRDFFEDVAKLRAVRPLWAKIIKERYQAQDPRSYRLRISTGGGGAYLTKRQVKNNISRLTLCALAAILGGSQSLNLSAYDEGLAIPTEEAARTSLMVQQILAHESGVANTADPLGGSYFIESLTKQIAEKAHEEMEKIEDSGGIVLAIENGKIQRKLAEQAYLFEKKLRTGEIPWIGVNRFVIPEEEEEEVETHEMAADTREKQIQKLAEVKRGRSSAEVARILKELGAVVKKGENLMPPIMQAVRCYATLGEIVEVLKDTYGSFKEPNVF